MNKLSLTFVSLVTATLLPVAYGESDAHTKMGHMGHEQGARNKAAEASIKLSVVNIEDRGDKNG